MGAGMSAAHRPPAAPGPARPPRPGLLARGALALYPPAWRARYGGEVRALLDESGGGLRAAASLAWRAVPAWIWPPQQVHDGPARMRASLATVLAAWSALAGLGLVFAQLTQLQGVRPAGHPVIGWAYLVFDAFLAISALAVAAGGLPLWLLMLRRARREHRPRLTAYLLLPLIAPVLYLATVSTLTRLVGGAQGVSPWWFLVITLLGFGAAGVAAAGPGAALHGLRPRGPAVHLATRAAAVAVATMAAAAAASSVAVIGLGLWARNFAGYHNAVALGVYLAPLLAAAAVAAISAARGTRAAHAGPGR
jgi:uncharacterized membrane protein YozB (DUF420 family)